jgi:hypothetical protein
MATASAEGPPVSKVGFDAYSEVRLIELSELTVDA